MKPGVSEFLHRVPWWLLFVCGLAVAVALAVFATPFQIIRLEHAGSTPEEKRAIKREIGRALSQGVTDLGSNVLREMRERATDPETIKELDRAIDEVENARESLREANAEAQRAKRESAAQVAGAMAEAEQAIRQAQDEAARALKDAGPEGDRVRRSLEESLKAAQEAKQSAEHADTAPPEPPRKAGPPKVVIVPPGVNLEIAPPPGVKVEIAPGSAPLPPLPPEMKQDIRKKLNRDLWRVGVGTGLLLIFLPLFILAVVAKFFIDRSRAAQKVAESKKREAEYHRMSRQVTEAKLAALQAQVEPHFLYNTLASVQALTEVDPQKAHDMTGHLIQYLRNALPKMRESVSTVGQEVELVRAYLNILQMRMGKRLAFDIEVAPGLGESPFPPLMLPSLVENAIKHGLEPQREGGRVSISIAAVDGPIRAVVADTGRGFGETVGAGVGLANIRERLAALYGDAAHLTLEANEPQGVKATIEIPRTAPSPEAVRASLASPPAVRQSQAQEQGAAAGEAQDAPAQPPSQARSRMGRMLSAIGTAERAWRKGLVWTFMVLTVVAAVLAVVAAVGVLTGMLHVNLGQDSLGSAAGAFLGTAGIAVAFIMVVVSIAIVLALVYGLGFFVLGVLVFVVAVVLIALFPVLAPVILLALGIAWLVRRASQRTPGPAAAPIESPDAHRHPG
jgi:hypothetical protein